MKKKEETEEEENSQISDSEIERQANEIIDEFKKFSKAVKSAREKIRRNPY